MTGPDPTVDRTVWGSPAPVRRGLARARRPGLHDVMLTLNGVDDLRSRTGTTLGTSGWHRVTQERIEAFADATEDWERIHVDPVRAAETPFGVTIAHGLYTLSLGPKLLYEIFTMNGHTLGLNYGFEKVRFLSPVRVGSRVRMRAELASYDALEGGSKFHILQTFEIEGAAKPACVAESVVAYFD